jgi:hypothetical protein
VSFKDHRIEFTMMQPPLNSGITFTHISPWIWHVYLDGKRVGTVNGDSMLGFTARDTGYHSIGRGFVSAEAAMQACVPVMASHLDIPSVLVRRGREPLPSASAKIIPMSRRNA